MGVLGDLNSTGALYQLYRQVYGQSAGDEAGSSRPIMSEAEFAALPEAQQFSMAGEAQQTNMFADGQGNAVGYGDAPDWLGMGAGSFVKDPSQIERTDGRFSVGLDNLNEDALLDRKNESDRSGYFSGTPLQNIIRGMATVAGGAYAANAAGLTEAGGAIAGATDIPVGGMLAESIAPQVTEVMAGSPFIEGAAGGATSGMLTESVAPQVTETMVGNPWEIQPGYLNESVAPQVDEFMYEPMVETPLGAAPQVTEVMSGSPFESNWLRDLFEAGRDALGGGGGGDGGNPVIAALMGGSGRIGEHKQDTDPYGLEASGYGPWKGLLDTPKQKVADAMMKRKKSIWS